MGMYQRDGVTEPSVFLQQVEHPFKKSGSNGVLQLRVSCHLCITLKPVLRTEHKTPRQKEIICEQKYEQKRDIDSSHPRTHYKTLHHFLYKEVIKL